MRNFYNSLKLIKKLVEQQVIFLIPSNTNIFEMQKYHSNNHNIFNADFSLCLNSWVNDNPDSKAGTYNNCIISRKEAKIILKILELFINIKKLHIKSEVIIVDAFKNPDVVWVYCALLIKGIKIKFLYTNQINKKYNCIVNCSNEEIKFEIFKKNLEIEFYTVNTILESYYYLINENNVNESYSTSNNWHNILKFRKDKLLLDLKNIN